MVAKESSLLSTRGVKTTLCSIYTSFQRIKKAAEAANAKNNANRTNEGANLENAGATPGNLGNEDMVREGGRGDAAETLDMDVTVTDSSTQTPNNATGEYNLSGKFVWVSCDP